MLGPFEVVDDGSSIPLGGAKQRALLAILAIHANEVVSVDTLIDDLWGERPPGSAPSTLQSYVSRLRKVVHNGAGATIAFGSGGYALRLDPALIDARRFAAVVGDAHNGSPQERSGRLRDALGLWRGPALADFRFEQFARVEIERLEELRLAALESRIDADLECGRHAALVPELEALVSEQPLRERFREQLMVALYRSGRQAEALDVYRQGRRLLVEELGLEPGPRLQELERAILAQDRALAMPTPTPGRRFSRVGPAIAIVVAAFVAILAAAALLSDGGDKARAAVVVLPDSLVAVDPATNAVVANRRIGGWPMPVTKGGGYVWAANTGDDTISRVDPARRLVLDNVFATTPVDLAWRSGVLWIADGNSYDGPNPPGGGTIERYDTKTGELVQARISPPADDLLTYVAAGAEGVWAGNVKRAGVVRLDPRTGRVVRAVPLTIQVSGLAVGLGSVWVSDAINDVVFRVNAENERIYSRILVSNGPRAIAVGDDAVWVVGEHPRSGVWRIDPRMNRAVAHVSVPATATAVAVGGGSVWVTSRTPGHAGPGSVTRIDPKTNTVVATIDLGFSPQGVVVANGLVWVAVGPM